MKCEVCKREISQKVADYSKEHFNKVLCFECQRKINQKEIGETKENVHPEANKKQMSKVKSPEGVSPENIITLQGKQFITHAGLLEVAHKKGLKSIDTMMVTNAESETAVFRAVVKLEEKGIERTFTGYGDANKSNVNSMILPHKIRMAETRAVNRALRFATNIGMCSIEELSE